MNVERSNETATVPGARSNRRQTLQALAAGTVAGLLGWKATGAENKRRNQPKRRRDQRAVNAEDAPNNPSRMLKVMTRNLYLGADLDPIFRVTSPQELVAAATKIFAMVQATDFPARAKALAKEIADTDPHIVGLQEVTLWRSQTPADFVPNPNASDIEFDFLTTLLDELARRGKFYEAVATVQNTDAEAPRATRNGLQDIRYTDRDVILARTDLPANVFSVSNAQSANFDAGRSVPIPVIGTLLIPRGWTAVDVTLKGRTVRVVNTHLEPSHPDIQVAQGYELLSGPLETSLPAVLLGDLNSAAGGGTPGESNTPTYGNLLKAGLDDAWTTSRGENPGFTWGHAEDLRNPAPDLTVRIDFILTRGGIEAASANRVGVEPEDRTDSGLWPSDHAGVWAVLHVDAS